MSSELIFYVTFLLMLLFFFVTAAAGEKYKPRIGHETSYSLVLGIIISVLLWYIGGGPSGSDDLS